MTSLLKFALGMCVAAALAASPISRADAAGASRGLAAVAQAEQTSRYLFIFFWKQDDAQSQRMFGVLQGFLKRMPNGVDSIGIQATDPNEQAIVEKFGVSRAPLPLVLALAPNGAVTKGIPAPFTEQDLEQAFVSRGVAESLKALQERKLVLLCVGNQRMRDLPAALQAAQQFQADARFAKSAQVVTLDPDDQSEASFLRDLQVDPRSPTVTTVVLAPPGQPVARFAGPVSKEQIVAKIAAAQSSACPGGSCGPGGCGPKR
jgi:hypothetical protein